MNRRSFIKRTALAVGIGVAVGKVAITPVKARAARSLSMTSGRSMTFDLRRFIVELERQRVGSMSEGFERWKNGPWEEILTVTTKGSVQIEQKFASLIPIEVYVGGNNVTVRGEFYEISNKKKVVSAGAGPDYA